MWAFPFVTSNALLDIWPNIVGGRTGEEREDGICSPKFFIARGILLSAAPGSQSSHEIKSSCLPTLTPTQIPWAEHFFPLSLCWGGRERDSGCTKNRDKIEKEKESKKRVNKVQFTSNSLPSSSPYGQSAWFLYCRSALPWVQMAQSRT